MSVDSLLDASLTAALGWTLLNFLWQGVLVAAAVSLVLGVLRPRRAEVRYAVCCTGLATMALAPPITLAIVLMLPGPAPAAASAASTAAAPEAWTVRLAEFVPRLALAWLAGVIVLQARLLLQWTRAQRLRSHGTKPAPSPWADEVSELATELGIRRGVRIFESTLARVPMLVGWLKPVILVPAGMATGLTPDQLRAVIAHELAHVRRHDYLFNLVQAVLETMLFYHPAVWWLSDRLRTEREYCCDDVAVRVGGSALRYAQALAILESRRGEPVQPVLASTGGPLMTRIQRLVGVPSPRASRRGGWMAPVAMAAVVGTVSALALARTEPRAHHPERHAEVLDRIDLVEVLARHEAREARLAELMREAGFTNEEIMMVLHKLQPEPQVMRAVEGALRRERHVEDRMAEIRAKVERAVAAGTMTEAEANEHLDAARMKVAAEVEQRLHRHQRARRTDESARRKIAQLEHELQRLLAAGEITDRQAKQRIQAARERLHDEQVLRRLEMTASRSIEQQLARIHEEIAAAVEAGNLTTAEARERLDRARVALAEQAGELARVREGAVPEYQRLRESILAELEAGRLDEAAANRELRALRERVHAEALGQLDESRRVLLEAIEPRLERLHEELRAEVESGSLTEAQARQRLEEHMRVLHERLRELHEKHERLSRRQRERQEHHEHHEDHEDH